MSYPTNPNQPPFHGQEVNGYTFDASIGQWRLSNPDETVAGKQKSPSKKQIAIGAAAGLAAVLALGGIANLVSDDSDSETTTSSSSYTATATTPDDRFIQAYKAAGYTHEDGNSGILEAGYLVCDGFDAGLTERQIVSAGYSGNQDTNGSLERDDITEIVQLSTQYLCTEYDN